MSPQMFSYVLFSALLAKCLFAVNLPDVIKKCHETDETCLVEQANNFLSSFPMGIPELGFNSLEPYVLGDVDVPGVTGGPTRLDLYLQDLKIHNYSTTRVTLFKINRSAKPITLTMHTFSPQTLLKGRYKATGNVLILPVNGHGDLEWKLTGSRGKVKVTLTDMLGDDGRSYIKLIDMKGIAKPDHIHINMTNLMNGNPEISASILDVINENWQVVSGDINERVMKVLMAKHKAEVKKFLSLVTWEDLFLPTANKTGKPSID